MRARASGALADALQACQKCTCGRGHALALYLRAVDVTVRLVPDAAAKAEREADGDPLPVFTVEELRHTITLGTDGVLGLLALKQGFGATVVDADRWSSASDLS